MKVEFVKMQGAGNDFVVVDEWDKQLVGEKEKPAFVEKICDRHFGVGADGVIFIQKSEKADANFVFFNPDGSRAEMCGNGIRCFAKYLNERKLVSGETISAETPAGVLSLKLDVAGGAVKSVTVSMGAPQVKRGDAQVLYGDSTKPLVDEVMEFDGLRYHLTAVGMGNPHAIVFEDDVDAVEVRAVGSRIRNHLEVFPNGVNVHFVEEIKENEFEIRTFERGVEDETLACGTGICASAVAAVLNERADASKPILFHARGGDITINLKSEEGEIIEVLMSGPAEEVFSGVWI